MQFVRPVLISVTLGSAVIAGIVYLGYSLAWFENFPRSVFLVDWVIVLGLSLAMRFLFRISRIYKPYPAPG
jgi:Zn-dependent protease with chaperone function